MPCHSVIMTRPSCLQDQAVSTISADNDASKCLTAQGPSTSETMTLRMIFSIQGALVRFLGRCRALGIADRSRIQSPHLLRDRRDLSVPL